MSNTKTSYKEETGIVENIVKQLLLHNDDVNSFQYVEECLIKVCNHTPEQAQQCALIVHNTGKCSVMHGDIEELVTPAQRLSSLGLTVSIK